MSDNYKPGGGNKPQPYIPAGNGEKSGEYTDKPISDKLKPSVKHCFIKNVLKKYNFKGSKKDSAYVRIKLLQNPYIVQMGFRYQENESVF